MVIKLNWNQDFAIALSLMLAAVRSFVQQDLDEEDIPAEPEQEELTIITQMFNGWRCSCRRANEHRVQQQMEYLGKLHEANADISTRLQDGERFRSLEWHAQRADARKAARMARNRASKLAKAAEELPMLAPNHK